MKETLIKISTAAKRFGVTRQAMYKKIVTHRIPVEIFDGVRFLDETDLPQIRFRKQNGRA